MYLNPEKLRSQDIILYHVEMSHFEEREERDSIMLQSILNDYVNMTSNSVHWTALIFVEFYYQTVSYLKVFFISKTLFFIAVS